MLSKNTKNTVFVSAIESHGSYTPVSESAVNSKSSVKELKVVLDTDKYTAIQITNINGNTKLFITSNYSSESKHNVKINGNNYQWTGNYYFK